MHTSKFITSRFWTYFPNSVLTKERKLKVCQARKSSLWRLKRTLIVAYTFRTWLKSSARLCQTYRDFSTLVARIERLERPPWTRTPPEVTPFLPSTLKLQRLDQLARPHSRWARWTWLTWLDQRGKARLMQQVKDLRRPIRSICRYRPWVTSSVP